MSLWISLQSSIFNFGSSLSFPDSIPNRKRDPDGRSLPYFAGQADRPPVQSRNHPADRKSQACPPV